MKITRKLVWGTLLVVALVVCFGFKGCGDAKGINRALDGIGIPTSDAQFKYSLKTPRGVSIGSVVNVPVEAQNAIDRGVQRTIDKFKALRPQWQAADTHAEVRLLFVEPSTFQDTPRKGQKCSNLETDPGSPCLLVKGIQTAGTVIGATPFSAVKELYIVLPHQADTNWSHLEYLEMSAAFEDEHFEECSKQLPGGKVPAECMYFYGAGDVHPHDYGSLPF